MFIIDVRDSELYTNICNSDFKDLIIYFRNILKNLRLSCFTTSKNKIMAHSDPLKGSDKYSVQLAFIYM